MRGMILYTSDRGGAYDLWSYTPLTGSNRPLTRGLGEIYSVPYRSPNGRKIAFIGLDNIVYVVDLRTAAIARIDQLDPYTLLDWSPDSRFLSYAKNGTIVVYDTIYHAASAMAQPGAADVQWFPYGERLLYAAPDSGGHGQLYAVRPDGTRKTQLTRNTEGPIHQARLSPSGRYALYTHPGASISLITTVDLGTGRKHTLAGGPLAKNYNPAWSPDSASIAYSATVQENSEYRSLIQTDTAGGGTQETRAVSGCFASPVAWAPDGRHLAYLSGCTMEGAATELRAVDLLRPATPSMLLVSGGHYTSVSWEAVPSWH
jgi:TolB protein